MKENLKQMKLAEKVNIIGQMENSMTDSGRKIKCMAQEYLHGRMANDMKENLSMTKGKEEVTSLGQMVDNISENGKQESSMAKEHILVKMELRRTENGKMVRRSDGLTELPSKHRSFLSLLLLNILINTNRLHNISS